MKEIVIFRNQEFKVFADEHGKLYEYRRPYTDCEGRLVNTYWELINPVWICLHNKEKIGTFHVEKSILIYMKGIGPVGPFRTFYNKMKQRFGKAAARKITKFYKKELLEADNNYVYEEYERPNYDFIDLT